MLQAGCELVWMRIQGSRCRHIAVLSFAAAISSANTSWKAHKNTIMQSEVGGSEFAFRQAPSNREIVSCRTCVRAKAAKGLSCGNALEI